MTALEESGSGAHREGAVSGFALVGMVLLMLAWGAPADRYAIRKEKG